MLTFCHNIKNIFLEVNEIISNFSEEQEHLCNFEI